ncbi:MAG TPA: hypothetical protein VEQ60_05500, partial [Longimicrobium sp.]|nr:hypothetical protein [Longimicrobium sp.]
VEKKRVYAWRSGPSVPGPEMRPQITAVEVLLGVPPGTLTELMLPPKATRNAPRTSFAACLRMAVASSGKKVKELAGEVGCRPNTLFGWMRGGEPGPRNRPVVSLLESSLGLEANALLSRLRPAHLVTLSYIVPLSPSQQEEWERFYVHKTHKAEPDAERRPQEYWRVRPDGRCPTGGKVLLDVRRFYGCLSLPVDADDVRHRGLGLPADSLSLVNFALRKHLEFAVNFHAQRSGGFGGAAVMTIHLAASLVREGTGFLSQGHGVDWRSFPVDQLEGQPSNSKGGITLERWRAHCAHLHRFLRQWVDHLDHNKLLKPIRDYRHIEPILRLDRPMKVLLLLERRMKKLYARRWARASPNTRARMIRDLIFVSMINRNPLRAEQWQYMTIATVDVPGHLRKESNGHYFLHIPEEEFKAPADFKGRDYEAAIDPELTPLIDDYLANYRPLLIGAGMCNLFLRPSRRWSESHQEDHGEPVNATQLASLLTGTHLLDYATRGFGPHAWRHIIATHLVKNHPETGIRLAARALHNSEDMIKRHYGHLQVRDHTSVSHKIIQAELEIDRAELDRLD